MFLFLQHGCEKIYTGSSNSLSPDYLLSYEMIFFLSYFTSHFFPRQWGMHLLPAGCYVAAPCSIFLPTGKASEDPVKGRALRGDLRRALREAYEGGGSF